MELPLTPLGAAVLMFLLDWPPGSYPRHDDIVNGLPEFSGGGISNALLDFQGMDIIQATQDEVTSHIYYSLSRSATVVEGSPTRIILEDVS